MTEFPPPQSLKRKLLFQKLVASSGKTLPELAADIGLSRPVVSSYNATRGRQPSDSAMLKVLEVVNKRVDEVIALARALEAENPLPKDEFIKRFRTNSFYVAETGRRSRIRLPARVGSVGDLRIIHEEGRFREAAAERGPYAFKVYRKLVIDAGPPLIYGEPLPSEQRPRIKKLLAWFIRGFSLTRLDVAKLLHVEASTVGSWLDPDFPVTPSRLVPDLMRPYSRWAVDTRDALDHADLAFPAPELDPDEFVHWHRDPPEELDERQKEAFRRFNERFRARTEKGN